MSQPYSTRYTFYVLFLLLLVSLFNTVDRTIISVLVDDIKVDLGFSDRQMGFIMGFAFSITYFLAGIPIARLADSRSRKKIIAAALATWSLMTALSGTVQTYLQMVIVRMGVGLGEAGGSPPSQSLITDYVEPRHRAKAMTVITVGALAGAGLGVVYGGWASVTMGWRMALVAIGIPGILLALLFLLTVREPPRRASDLTANDSPTNFGIIASLRLLMQNRAFVYLVMAASFISIVSMGRIFWEPTFMRRIYELSAEQAGYHYFILGPLPSAIGVFWFAYITDKLGARDIRWYAWLPALTTLLLIPLSLVFYFLSPDIIFTGIPLGYYFSFAASLVAAGWTPAIMALAQSIVPSNQRAMAAAAWSMVGSLVGSGIGPFIVGDLNVRLEADFGTDAIRYSLAALYVAPVLAILCLYKLATAIGESKQKPI